jgi:hypothetical protein
VVPVLLPAVSLEILIMSCDHYEKNVFFELSCIVCPLLKLAYANIGMPGHDADPSLPSRAMVMKG